MFLSIIAVFTTFTHTSYKQILNGFSIILLTISDLYHKHLFFIILIYYIITELLELEFYDTKFRANDNLFHFLPYNFHKLAT